jgi:hypothetical protein
MISKDPGRLHKRQTAFYLIWMVLLFLLAPKISAQLPLEEALDTSHLDWESRGSWISQFEVTYDNQDALASGTIADEEAAELSLKVVGPLEGSFWWKVSSEEDYDFLYFSIDGVLVSSISGDVDWTKETFELGAGAHRLDWGYRKDESLSDGMDTGWLDQFTLSLEETVSIIEHPAALSLVEGASGTFSVIAQGGAGIRYQWFKDGVAIEGAHASTLVISGAQGDDAGDYHVRVQLGAATIESEAASLTVLGASNSIDDALETDTLPWGTQDGWEIQSTVAHDGEDALKTHAMQDNQAATLALNLQGPLEGSFWWKVSSEKDYDVFSFSVDGAMVSQISGEANWAQVTFELEDGNHQLKWVYAKDDSVFWGADAAWLDQLSLKRAEGPLPEGIYFLENFDGLALGPFESSSESKGDGTDWTGRGPEGWIMARGPGHGLVDGGQSVTEYDGWTFLDPVSWNASATQDRDQFTKGKGVVAVADSDEFDDLDDAVFNASLSTPAIDIRDASPRSLVLHFDSSWRQEPPQTGYLTAQFDEGSEVTLLELDASSPSALNATYALELNNPAGARYVVLKWHYQGNNNWWWALDNIRIQEVPKANEAPSANDIELQLEEGSSVAVVLTGADADGDSLSYSLLSQPEHGALTGTPPSLVYTPDAGFSGMDAFTYRAHDGTSDSLQATVLLEVIPLPEQASLQTSKEVYTLGDDIEVSFSGGPGNPKDWIGVYAEESQAGVDNASLWLYVDGTQEGNEGLRQGTLLFADLSAGNYVIHLLLDDAHEILASASFKVLQGQAPLPEGVYFLEDFDGLALGPFESSTESNGDATDWTSDGPDGWLMTRGPGHGPVEGGQGVKEFDGWTFLDPVSWDATAQQERNQFTKGTGVIAVADSDEFDDLADATFDASLRTPIIDIRGASPGSLVLTFDSSWRQEPQRGTLSAYYDDGTELELLSLDGNSPDALNATLSFPLNNPAGASELVVLWDYQGSNNWWWAIDNIRVHAEVLTPNTAPVVENVNLQLNQGATLSITLQGSDAEGDTLSFTVLSQPEHGSLSGDMPSLVYTPQAGFSGSDRFRYKANDGSSDSQAGLIQIEVIAQVARPVIQLSQAEYKSSQQIKLEFSGGPGNPKDWLGIYAQGMQPGQDAVFAWHYTDGTEQGLTATSSGSATFAALSPGDYKVYLFADNEYEVLASATFKVTSGTTRWTILVYGHADSSITPNFLSDLEEMQKVGSNDQFNIIVQTDLDGSKTLALDIYEVKEPFRTQTVRSRILRSDQTILEVMPEMDMDDPNVLRDFIDWGLRSYPADKYGLVLWDHGGQYLGYGGDHQNGTRDWSPGMKTADIRDVTLETMNKHQIGKFDFATFDTCLMGGAEQLVDMHEICDLFIACPEIDFAAGWDYAATLNALKDFPGMSLLEFAEKEVAFWDLHHNRMLSDKNYKVHVAYDMTKFDAYNASLKAFTSQIKEASPETQQLLARLRRDAIHYRAVNHRGDGEDGPSTLIDLGSFAQALSREATGALQVASAQLLERIHGLVISKALGTRRQDAVGLSIHYPIDGTIDDSYFSGAKNFLQSSYGGAQWKEFLETVELVSSRDKSAPLILAGGGGAKSGRVDKAPAEAQGVHVATWEEPALMTFEVIDGEDAYAAYASLVSNAFTDNPNEYIYLGEIGSAELDGEGAYDFSWDGSMPILSLADSDTYEPIYLGGWALEAGSDLYHSFADYQAPNEEKVHPLILITSFDENGHGTIDQILDDSVATESSGSGQGLAPVASGIQFEPGGLLWPVYYMEEWTGNEYEPWLITFEDGSITIPDTGLSGLEISYQTVESGDYTIELETVDLFDNASEVITYFVSVPEELGDSASRLSITLDGQHLRITWPSYYNGYQLQWSESLNGSPFKEVPAEQIVMDGDLFTLETDAGKEQRFYRLVKP